MIIQNKELRASNEELKKSTETLERQNEFLAQQNFENTFFQMLGRFNDIVLQTSGITKSGREAFKEKYDRFLSEAHQTPTIVNAKQRYLQFYAEWQHELGHYMRTLYHIFSFVDRSSLPEEKKIIYTNILRAQLSTYELCILFYNGLVGEGEKGFKPLIEKYGIQPGNVSAVGRGQAQLADVSDPYSGKNRRVQFRVAE